MIPPRRRTARFSRVLASLVLASAALPVGVSAQSASVGGAEYALQREIDRLVQGTGWRTSDWGVLAVSLERGDTLAALGPDLPLAPASNQKLFTTAAALHHLGPDFRFPTFLLTDGEVRDGVLEGRLILYGTGDPAISDRLLSAPTDPFRTFARTLREMGVHTVRGEVLGDGSYFEGPSRRPSWNPNDLDNWYAAPVSALTFNENVVTLRIRAGVPGSPAGILTQPAGAVLPIVNRSVSVAAAPRAPLLVVRDHPDDPIEIRGELRMGSSEVWRVLTVSDPAAYAASVLRTVLEEEGIRVLGGARSLPPEEASSLRENRVVAPAFRRDSPPALRTLDVHYSPPVREILRVVNQVSHNLFAELMLFAVGKVTTGTGSFEAGSLAVRDYLVGTVGIRPDDLHIEDGSGLSRLNRATPSSFVTLLTHVAAWEEADTFWWTLPEAGNRRELGRMFGTAAAGNLRAKTGTINRVSALSGVVRGADGEPILFSILSNNVPSTSSAKGVEDRIGIQLASFIRGAPPAGEAFAQVEFGEFGPRLTQPVPGGGEAPGAARR